MNQYPIKISRCVLLAACAGLVALTGGTARAQQDYDQDGVADDVERLLIDKHTPVLLYDALNDKWPSSIMWYVQRSGLAFGGTLVIPNSTLQANPELLYQVASPPSSTVGSPTPSGYRIDIDNAFHGGEGPIAVGMYAHVVPLQGPVTFANTAPIPVGPDHLLIQYWQFFPYNDAQAPGCCEWWCPGAPCDPGDHEGDWLWIDVFVDREAPHTLRYMVYHHHGDGNCAPTVLPWNYPLPTNGTPLCYLEEDAHEWWPHPGEAECGLPWQPPHNGNGPVVYYSNVPNVGERYAPEDDPEARMMLLYNGKWGFQSGSFADPADSPVHQYFPLPPLVVANVATSGSDAPREGRGMWLLPYKTPNQASAAVEPQGTVLFQPGTYSGVGTYSKASTWISDGGITTIGN